ncbi:MAG: hypothetical protein ACFFBD_11235 [Candidatus Hodarchaeota archaeon]
MKTKISGDKDSGRGLLDNEKLALINIIKGNMRQTKPPDISKDLNRLAFAVMVFKDLGPTPVAHYNMNFMKKDPNSLLLKFGILLMTAIGQGTSYYEGLYGPFPVHGYKDQLAYVYSFFIYDNSIKDCRIQNRAYSTLILFFPRRITNCLQASFKIISQVLSRAFSEITDIQELTESFLEKIKDQLKFAIDYWHLLSC